VTVFLGMQKHRDFGSALWHGRRSDRGKRRGPSATVAAATVPPSLPRVTHYQLVDNLLDRNAICR
jgi:hypothetical protein